jgi:hypothetical protein
MTKRRLLILAGAAFLFGALVFAITIEANVYLESTHFCANTCHVMEPERDLHAASPHANVECGICHIEEGLAGFLRAKFIDGTRELVSLVTATYPTPIPTPLHHRMPARIMCEKCHWPDKFYGRRLVTLDRYDPDIVNTHHQVQLLMNVGGGRGIQGDGRGIHWHIQNRVEFGHRDAQRQDIPWVRAIAEDGTERLYLREGEDAAVVGETELRDMDCIDCHNRATHAVDPPVRRLDRMLALGHIDASLPEVKRRVLELVDVDYASAAEAQAAIREGVTGFYAERYPKIAQARAADITIAADRAQEIFDATRFPEMKLTWKTHPNNLGHREFPGCFRCHDGRHTTSDGERIRQRCDLCHQSIGEVREEDGKLVTKPFVVLGEAHAEEDCTTCHVIHGQQQKTYDVRPERAACMDCHEDEPGDANPAGFVAGAPHADQPCHECHAIHFAARPPQTRCGRCHPGIEEKGMHPAHLEEELSCERCHPPHAFKPSAEILGETCGECHDEMNMARAIEDFMK